MLGRRARQLWWWRLPIAVGLVLLAVTNVPPYLFNSPTYEQAAFLVAAFAMVVATFRPTVGWAVAACVLTVAAFLGRALVLIFVDSFLTESQIARGVTTWTLGSFMVVMLTIALDRQR